MSADVLFVNGPSAKTEVEQQVPAPPHILMIFFLMLLLQDDMVEGIQEEEVRCEVGLREQEDKEGFMKAQVDL